MFSGEATAVSGQVRDRLSLALLIVGMIAIVGVGAAQLAKDGSLWRDEASVAVSLLTLSPLELFGRLDGGQSFPRLYLFAIAGMKAMSPPHSSAPGQPARNAPSQQAMRTPNSDVTNTVPITAARKPDRSA